MEYLFVTWQHEDPDEPIEFYMELDETRSQTRALERFENGEIAFATQEEEYNTFLGKEAYPDLNELNSIEGFCGKRITKEAFEKEWTKATKRGELS